MAMKVSFAHLRHRVNNLFLRSQDGRLELRDGHDHAHKIALAVIIATIAVQILNDNLSKSQSSNSIQDHIKNKIIPITIVAALIDIFNSVTSIIIPPRLLASEKLYRRVEYKLEYCRALSVRLLLIYNHLTQNNSRH